MCKEKLSIKGFMNSKYRYITLEILILRTLIGPKKYQIIFSHNHTTTREMSELSLTTLITSVPIFPDLNYILFGFQWL